MIGSLKYWINGEPTLPNEGLGSLKYWINGEAYVVLTEETAVYSYSRGDYAELPTNDTDLENAFSGDEYTDVSTEDGVYVLQSSTEGFSVFQFKNKHTNSSDTPSVRCRLKTNVAPSVSPVYLQVYNRTLGEWQTRDFNNSASADTAFDLTDTLYSGLDNYYDENYWLSYRVYQAL